MIMTVMNASGLENIGPHGERSAIVPASYNFYARCAFSSSRCKGPSHCRKKTRENFCSINGAWSFRTGSSQAQERNARRHQQQHV